jgi:hypothetical protein
MTNIIFDAIRSVDSKAVHSVQGSTIFIYTTKTDDMLSAMNRIGEHAWISAKNYVSIKR